MRRSYVRRSVGLSSALWQNGGTHPDACRHYRSDESREVARFGDRSTGRGTLGANLGRAIVTNRNFTAYVCDSAATRPSSQITLGRLVFLLLPAFRGIKVNIKHTTARRVCAPSMSNKYMYDDVPIVHDKLRQHSFLRITYSLVCRLLLLKIVSIIL